ncbi:aldo/keto reductase [Croceicoccus estronivorus]|uniref:aldo/keto reductase n=1 Tax=Croceicoccus estronivorus TaxID=1172626 RepID=UPI000835BF1B|nr:aldo/keto reductase [Croceicoccus estronivorus]OCC25501.1 aldo/keto reductase [Croceicoccus estronivorus]
MLKKVILGSTDLNVSQLCYGTNMFGTAIDQDRANAILDKFVELGGNFIDTARMYGDWIPDAPTGASERTIGGWLKARGNRSDVVIATKGGMFDSRAGDYRNRVNPDDIAKDLGESLDHLGIDTIDLYFLHMDNPEVPVKELIDALAEHQAAGKIRYYAASNWAADRIVEANEYAKSAGKPGFIASETFWGLAKPNEEASNQQGYVHYYEGEYETLHKTLPILPYAATSGGYFAMRDKGEIAEHIAARYANPANDKRFAMVKELAGKHGVSLNEIVLAYLLNQPNQTIPIFGGSSPQRIEEGVKATAITLTADELAQLRAD